MTCSSIFLAGLKEGGSGLADVCYLGPAQPADVTDARLQDVAPVDLNRAARQFHTAAPIGHGGKADRGFARAGFPDQTQYLAGGQIEIHTMHDLDVARFFSRRINRCADFQATDSEKWFAHPRPPFRLVVRFSTQSATRLIEMHSTAIA